MGRAGVLILLALIVVVVLGEWILALALLPLALALLPWALDHFLLRRSWAVDVVRGRELIAAER